MKPLALFVAIALAMIVPLTVSAANADTGSDTGSTELTAVVGASYHALIPAASTLSADNADAQNFGTVTVTNVSHVGILYCTPSGTDLTGTNGTIPVSYTYQIGTAAASSFGKFVIYENGNDPYAANLFATVSAADWASAVAGTYKATVTFTFEMEGQEETPGALPAPDKQNLSANSGVLLDGPALNAKLHELAGDAAVRAVSFRKDALLDKVTSLKSLDVSALQNGSLIAHLTDDDGICIVFESEAKASADLSYAFSGFSVLEYVDMRLLDASAVTNTDGLINGCEPLCEVEYPSNWPNP